MNKNLPYWLAAIAIPGVGPRTIKRWLNHFGSVEKVFKATFDEWIAAGIPQKYFHHLQNPNWAAVEKDIDWVCGENCHILTLQDENYPALLKEIADPPPILYVQGQPHVLSMPQLAIVGSRHATIHGLQNAEQFAYCLAEGGFAITSGLARGIDGAAHLGALNAKGVTIGVAGTGLNQIYPAKHESLVTRIVQEGGAVISELPLVMGPQAMNFPRRNRIIAGLSVGVLVVEAALKSGSLITATQALDAGREIFAIPGSIHNPLSKGCHALIRQGAKLVETAGDILEELGGHYRPVACVPDRSLEGLSAPLKSILEQIGYEITPLDVVLLHSGLTVSELSSMLLTLELDGYIQSMTGGYIRVNRST